MIAERHTGKITGDPEALLVLQQLTESVQQLIEYCDAVDRLAATTQSDGMITTDRVRRMLGVPR